MKQLNEDEKDFIELSLIGRDNVEIYETESNIEIIQKKKSRKKRKKSNKGPFYLMGFIGLLPFLVTAAFMTALYRVEAFVGGKETLEWLSKQEITPEIEKTISGIGLDWLPMFLEIYSNRGAIIATIFTVPFVIIAGIAFWLINRSKDDDSSTKEKDNEVTP